LNLKLKIKNWKIFFFEKKWNFQNFQPILLRIFFLNFGLKMLKNGFCLGQILTGRPVFKVFFENKFYQWKAFMFSFIYVCVTVPRLGVFIYNVSAQITVTIEQWALISCVRGCVRAERIVAWALWANGRICWISR
jgi:hypothetical protein